MRSMDHLTPGSNLRPNKIGSIGSIEKVDIDELQDLCFWLPGGTGESCVIYDKNGNPVSSLDSPRYGVDALDPLLTINGITVAPMLRYKGGDTSAGGWAPWGYGESLIRQGAGHLYNQGSPGLCSNDDSYINGGGGTYFYAGNNNLGDSSGVGHRYVFEVIGKGNVVKTGLADTFFQKTLGNDGYRFSSEGATGRLYFYHMVGVNNYISGPTIGDSWFHALVWWDGTNACMVVNGTSTVYKKAGADLAFLAQPFRIGYGGYGQVALVNGWNYNSWFATANESEIAAIAAERNLRWRGLWPQVARGTKMPTVKTRAFAAYSDKMEGSGAARRRALYMHGSEGLRTCSGDDLAGVEFKGYLSETQVKNFIIQSQTFASWTKEDAGDVITNAVDTAPDKTLTGCSFVADNTNGLHGVTMQTPDNLTAAVYCMSCFIKAGTSNWWRITNTTIANGDAFFNVNTGVVGVGEGAGILDVYIEGPFVGDYYRVIATFTGTVVQHTISIGPCDADGTATYSGGNSVDIQGYTWGCMVELGIYSTSYIPTVAATATRLADQLRFKGDDGGLGGVGSEKKGTIIFDILRSAYIPLTPPYTHNAALTDGGSFNEYIGVSHQAAAASFVIKANGGVVNETRLTTTNVRDGNKHTFKITWRIGNAKCYVDNIKQGADLAPADIPDDLDRITPGDYSGSNQANALISNLKIYRKVV